ncbi:hypothetical protein [Azospirillum baldaniorum]|nr:hypothetical protein [Azospirillum baldaniorum]
MPRRFPDNPPDWPAIRADYESGLPLARIAICHASSEPTIRMQAKVES